MTHTSRRFSDDRVHPAGVAGAALPAETEAIGLLNVPGPHVPTPLRSFQTLSAADVTDLDSARARFAVARSEPAA